MIEIFGIHEDELNIFLFFWTYELPNISFQLIILIPESHQ